MSSPRSPSQSETNRYCDCAAAVLAPAPRDPVVHDHQLPVIAEVDASANDRPQRIAHGERHPDVATGVAHVAPVAGPDQPARAERIGEQPHLDPAAGCPNERVFELQSVVVGQPDVEAAMRRLARCVDVGDHVVHGGIAVRRQPRAVAAGRIEVVDRPGKGEGRPMRAAGLTCASVISGWARQSGVDLLSARPAWSADPRLP